MLQRFRGRARLALAGGLIVVLVVGLTAVYAAVRPSQALGAQATLTILSGTVEVRGSDSGSFVDGNDGGLIGAGATVRTGDDGNAIITLFDGSTVTIQPSSELTLEKLEATGSGDVIISLLQNIGRSWHVIGHRMTGDSQYQVRTPTATASVRGTAFEWNVDAQGNAEAVTTDGIVATTSEGETVEVGPGEKADVPADAPPSEPEPAPKATVVLTIVIDGSAGSGVAVDDAGRAVGIGQDGRALRYVPGSRVEYTSDGKIVMKIPQETPGQIRTFVDAGGSNEPVVIQTQIESQDIVVANTIERRHPDADGTAKGGFLQTSAGVLTLSDEDAKAASRPDIGKIPGLQVGLFQTPVATPAPLVIIQPRNDPAQSSAPDPSRPDAAANHEGGFQAYGNYGAAGAAMPDVSVVETRTIKLSELPEDLRAQILGLVPPPPPGADIQGGRDVQAPAGSETRPADPSAGQPNAERLAEFFAAIGKGEASSPWGALQTGPSGGPGADGNATRGGLVNCERGLVGLVCSDVRTDVRSGDAPTPIQPCAEGRRPSAETPCFPIDPSGRASTDIPPCAEGQVPSPQSPCMPSRAFPGGPGGDPANFPRCAADQVPTPASPCVPSAGQPGPGAPGSVPICAAGRAPTEASPCVPSSLAGAPGSGGAPTLPACAPGQRPSPASPCLQTAGAGGTPTCPPGTTPTSPGFCAGPTAAPAPGGAVPPPGVAAPTCPPGTTPVSPGVCRGESVPVSPPTSPTPP